MADIVNKETRYRMMSGIRSKDTRPEPLLRRALPKHRGTVFVHGCFWHRHEGCRFASTPATRPEFWAAKFAANIRRDQRVVAKLSAEGWRIAIVRECALKRQADVHRIFEQLTDWILDGRAFIEIGEKKPGS